jgi:hypothetical protein
MSMLLLKQWGVFVVALFAAHVCDCSPQSNSVSGTTAMDGLVLTSGLVATNGDDRGVSDAGLKRASSALKELWRFDMAGNKRPPLVA